MLVSQEEYRFDPSENDVVPTETIATTVEVHPDPNGVAIVVDEVQASEQVVNGCEDGIVPELQQVAEPASSLYNMDLERMHADLYKRKYLTPQDFIDDVQKIVHNAEVRIEEDPERLYKAQAMLTMAHVSINDFDPQLRIECDRMAARERKRREEHKKNKSKGRVQVDNANSNGTYAPGTRRSARNNGQQPEISITDPLKLERTLKRQRSNEAAADSPISEDENSDSRTSKRSKMVVSDDYDPLDIVGPTSSQPRPTTVRFAANVQLSDIGEPSPLVRQQTPGLEETEGSVDASPMPRRASGFDPSLLNPLPPADIFSATISPNSGINGVIAPSTSYSLPFEPFREPGEFRESSVDYTSPPRTPVRTAGPSKTFDVPPPRTPSPIVVERQPTPHPEFHVDETLLQTLKFHLRERTAHLTVEQLEQLRASCLSCVWRNRAEWNRDDLIRELKEIVKEFIDELVAYDVE